MNFFQNDLYDTYLKRVIDLAGSILLLIIFLPLGILLAILIRLDSSGPIFADTPQRVGRNGKLFKMYKFRSMIENAHILLRKDPKLKSLYEQYKRNRKHD